MTEDTRITNDRNSNALRLTCNHTGIIIIGFYDWRTDMDALEEQLRQRLREMLERRLQKEQS